jgi:uncharacterized coiled-coil protein SlyX
MEHGFVARILDRVVANARVIRGAPEAVALVGIITLGISYFAFQHFQRERLAVLNERIASQEGLLTGYRAKLNGATPEEAAAQIEQLTNRLAETQKNLDETKSRLTSVENRPRDPLRLYKGNRAIAQVQDPKVDLGKKIITFPAATSAVFLEMNSSYEFQNWKLACGGTRLYNTANYGVAQEFSYSPLTCKILGNR